MTIVTTDEITVLTAQCKELETQLAAKRNELRNTIIRKLTDDGKHHPLVSFLGKMGTYDRPRKWGKPRSNEFTQEDADNKKYLKFNGIVTGEEINTLYDRPLYKKVAQFYSFVIPGEFADELVEGEPVPINDVYELLIFEVK